MWTNIFKISGLHQISWFQFLPQEFDFNVLADKSHKLDQKDAAMVSVLSAHLQLQKEGFLSSWTNYFVGPWDPSQGLHNPDEKIKLWLFLPGQHSSVVEKAQVAVAKLRVLASGIWVSPGDSEEFAFALSQALRNCIERPLRGLSYVRFGDAFSKYHPLMQNEEPFRRGEPVAEFIFAATEEAIFVHVVVSAKNVRALSSSDIEPFFSSSTRHSNERISVVVSPHGMLGKLTGYCPDDLVKQVYLGSGKVRDSSELVGLSHNVSQGSGVSGQPRGQNCFVEVTLGSGRAMQKSANVHSTTPDKFLVYEKHFVYPSEAVLVPLMRICFARSSLKRFWLQNWVGPSLSGSALYVNSDDRVASRAGSSLGRNETRSGYGYHSSSNSNSSSNCSISSSSADGDHKNMEGGDLEADADSLMTRQSALSSLDPVPSDGPQLGSKRPRAGTSESCGQGTVINPAINDYGTGEVNNMGDSGSANEQTVNQWGWDDDDKGMGMDIQELLSEFGDFGDFFEDDALPFGEPPSSEQSQAPMFHVPEGVEVAKSPSSSMMDVSDQMLLPSGISSFDNPNQLQTPATFEDFPSKINEATKSSSGKTVKELPFYNVEFDHVVKAEAEMTFAPNYGAVEAPGGDSSSVIFQSPYTPKDYKMDCVSSSNGYVYSATPPSSPVFTGCENKSVLPASMKAWKERSNKAALKSSKYYTHVDKGKQPNVASQNYLSGCEITAAPSQFSSFGKQDAKSLPNKSSEGSLGGDNILTSLTNGVASQIECLVCQASMCRLRHTLMPSRNLLPSNGSGLSVNSNTNQSQADMDNISGKFELKKKEMIPGRIAGDTDTRMLDGPLNAAVGVWRSVGIPKINKTSSLTMEGAPLPLNSFIEESMLPYGQQQPLQELLDGIVLLAQQATSFVDLALDADCGDGPFGLLALEEQSRRGLSCGPSMAHAGCGGLLASCHSLDIAGIELADPLSVDVQASMTISLLQSDIKAALKSAFSSVEGPLSVADWFRGRSLSNEAGVSCEGLSLESTASASECRDSSVTGNQSAGEPRSPSLSSASGAPCSRADGIRGDEPITPTVEFDQQKCSWFRPTLTVVPFPSILVGYKDDWLKTASSSLQIWEKAPLEPYATQKHMSYYVVCPNIDPLITAAEDFFLQLGTVYETCKLGTHAPQNPGNEMEVDSGKTSSPGFVLLDCPQSMKIDTNNASMLGLISDYFLCLSNGWDLTSYLKTLTKALKTLKFGSSMTQGAKEENGGPCTVIYVVCPFPEPLAILQTVVESSVAIGSAIRSSSREKRSMAHNQVAKALSYSVAADESFSNVVSLTGFCIPKLVLQIVTVDAVFRVTSPRLNELVVLKEIAFTVYNKARRIMRGASSETTPSLSVPGRSNAVLMQMSSPVSGMWKDIVGSRTGGPSHQRESELDSSLRPGAWDNSWQVTRNSGVGSDTSRNGDAFQIDDLRCLFEPLYILSEPGSLERGQSPFSCDAAESSKILSDDCTSTSFAQTSASSGAGDNGPTPQNESPESDAASNRKSFPSLHCCYGWTEDWRWMVCIWTDARGELLDCYVYPFGGVSSRQDTKGLQSLFIQILQQGSHILQACSPEVKPREFVITRIGSFFELECQEWQKALYAAGGSDVEKWSLQLRRSLTDGLFMSSNGNPLQPQDMNLMQDRVLTPSPNPMYGPHLKTSTFIKAGIAQASSRKLVGGPAVFDNSKVILQWIQSISFVSVSIDHSLQLIYQSDLASSGASQVNAAPSNYIEGYSPVKSLGSMAASYIMIPSPTMRFLPHTTLQLPTCLTADSPPLAHLLHSKGSAIPLCTGFVVSKAVPSVRSENRRPSKEEWPSVLSISLVDYYGSSNFSPEKLAKAAKRGVNPEPKDIKAESHLILEPIAAELHALSWMTVSPAYMDRRTALPFHCDMVLRLRRLLHFADKLLSRPPEKAQL